MQYILNETEFQAFLDLKEENAKLSHKLSVATETREKDREQIKGLCEKLDAYRKTYASMNKTLCSNAQKMLVLDAELADLSSKLREAKRDCEGTSARLSEAEKISADRLKAMNNLMKENRRLKSEHVCVVQHPQTGTVKVISVTKADTYRKFGWIVSEEYLVDRPA